MPLQTLYKSRTGGMATVVAGNVDEVIVPMGSIAEMFVRSMVVPIVVVAATFFISWELAVAMMLIFPMAIPIYRWRRKFVGKFVRQLGEAHAATSAEIVEYSQGLPVLRAANATGGKAERLQSALKHLQDLQVKTQMRGILPNFTLWTLIEGGIVVVLALGVYMILGDTLTVAALAALLIMAVRLSESVAILTNVTAAIDLMEAGFEKLEEMFAIKPLDQKQPEAQPEKFDITFDNLTFAYEEGEKPELQNISITLPERSMTALVGPSGSGKTTLTRMIMRYADAQQGSVSIGGVDVRSIPQDELMQHISVVFQDVYLFDDSIIANIRMGKPDATDEEVEAAARAANCHEFISRLPEGYQTTVGDIGGTLSGGERQRISIARAILKDAPIVMLDEPTAALDTESELAVQKAIDTLVENRTVIVIAHRLSTIVGADQILVLEDGQLVQAGSHEELINEGGRYHSMWQAQQQVKNWHMIQHDEVNA
jgi:ATP-binding cassette subfamily B protein